MKKKVLVTDSSKAIRFLIQTVLEDQFEVITAQDAGAALYWMKNRPAIDLMICDPQISGLYDWELIEQLRTGFYYQQLQIIVIASLPSSILEQQCATFQVAHFFTKPFDPLALRKTVLAILDPEKNTGVFQN